MDVKDLLLQDIQDAPKVTDPRLVTDLTQDQPGYGSLFSKGAQAAADWNLRRSEELRSGKSPNPNDFPGIDWNSLEPEEKRAAISLAASVLPLPGGGLSGLLSKVGTKGMLGALGKALGWGSEGTLLGGGTQVVGNIAAGSPVTENLGPAMTTGAALNILGGAALSANPGLSPAAQALIDRGIVPTVGQAVNKDTIVGRTLRRAEDAVTSWPIVGDIAQNAKARGSNEFRNTVTDRLALPNQPLSSGTMPQRLQQARQELQNFYDKAGNMVDVPIFSNAYQKWYQKTMDDINSNRYYLPAPSSPNAPDLRQELRDFVDNRIDAATIRDPKSSRNDHIPGDRLKWIESEIKSFVRSKKAVHGTPDAILQNNMGQALQPAVTGIKQMRADLSPGAAYLYSIADPRWWELTALENASNRAIAQGGEITPYQGLAALRQQKKLQMVPKPGSLQELLQQGQEVFGNTLANSGTADRLGWVATLTGYPLNALAAIPAAIGASRPVQKGLLSLTQNTAKYGPSAQQALTVLGSQNPTLWSLLPQ